jgi:CelD/BcsL family acetyltransferase involved in cellulose biosynthesis
MLGVPKDSRFWHFLSKARKMHPELIFYMPDKQCSHYFYIDMPTSFGEYLQKFQASTRQKFRQKLRMLEKGAGGKLELVRVRNLDETPQFLDSGYAIAKKSWQRTFVGLPLDQIANRRDLLESMARRGALRSYFLKVGNNVVAFLLGFQSNGCFYAHETAIDEAYADTRFSPGQLLFYLVIKDCFELDKPNIFHFGQGTTYDIWYKKLFANRSGEEVTIVVLKNTFANRTKVAAYDLFEKCKLIVRRKRKSAE